MENWKMLRVKYAGGSGAMASQSIHHSIACSEFLGSVGLFFFFFIILSLFAAVRHERGEFSTFCFWPYLALASATFSVFFSHFCSFFI